MRLEWKSCIFSPIMPPSRTKSTKSSSTSNESALSALRCTECQSVDCTCLHSSVFICSLDTLLLNQAPCISAAARYMEIIGVPMCLSKSQGKQSVYRRGKVGWSSRDWSKQGTPAPSALTWCPTRRDYRLEIINMHINILIFVF